MCVFQLRRRAGELETFHAFVSPFRGSNSLRPHTARAPTSNQGFPLSGSAPGAHHSRWSGDPAMMMAARPISAHPTLREYSQPKLRDFSSEVRPPWTMVVDTPDRLSTSRAHYTQPPLGAASGQWPRGQFKPAQHKVSEVQPIWQTEVANVPLPRSTSASHFTYHHVRQQEACKPAIRDTAPYGWPGERVPAPTSTSTDAFQGVRMPRRTPCPPHTNPNPLWSSEDAYGWLDYSRSTSRDAFPRHTAERRQPCKPPPLGPPPWTPTAGIHDIRRSTSKDSFLDHSAVGPAAAWLNRKQAKLNRPKLNRPPY